MLAQQGLRGLAFDFPGSASPTARRLRLLVVGPRPLDRRGDRRARDRALPPGRARHRRADRRRVGDPQPRPGALPDRDEHDAGAGGVSPALVDAPVRHPGARARVRTLPLRLLPGLLPPGDRRPARGAPPRGVRPLRAAQARRRRPRLPTGNPGLRAHRGEAALSVEGHGRAALPGRIVWGERDPALGLHRCEWLSGCWRSTTRTCSPPSTTSKRTRRPPSPSRSPIWRPHWVRPRGARPRPVLHQPRFAALGKGDLDHVEVARRLAHGNASRAWTRTSRTS